MNTSIVFAGLSAINLVIVACSTASPMFQSATFINRHGHEITFTKAGATVGGKLYVGKDCSTKAMWCTKYGKAFAILAPRDCTIKFPYDWQSKDVRSVFLAPTPHNPRRALMSTTSGNLVSFIYDGKDGVTELYFDSSRSLGSKSVWHSLKGFDSDRIQFSKVSEAAFYSCESKTGSQTS